MKLRKNYTAKNIFIHLTSVFAYLFLLIMFSSCGIGRPKTPNLGIENKEILKPVIHIVNFDKEELGDIAQWYTGRSANSKLLLKYNNIKEKKFLKKGSVVVIPHDLVVNRAPYLKKNSAKMRNSKTKKSVKKEITKGSESDKKIPQIESIDLPKPTPSETKVKEVVATANSTNNNEIEENASSEIEDRRLELLKELMKK